MSALTWGGGRLLPVKGAQAYMAMFFFIVFELMPSFFMAEMISRLLGDFDLQVFLFKKVSFLFLVKRH